VSDNTELRKYRIELPNLIDDLDLSVYSFRLYVHIKRVAGANGGSCHQGTRKLAEACHMSTGQVSSAKKELLDKGLIAKTTRPSNGGTVDDLTPTDIWQRNYETYNKGVHTVNTLEPETGKGVHTVNTGVHTVNTGVHTVNERKNKEEITIKEEKIRTPRKSAGVPAEKSPHQKIMDAYQEILEYPIRDGPKEGNAAKWLVKNGYTPEQVQACYAHLKVQSFWREKHISLQTVAGQIGAFLHSKNGHINGKHLRQSTERNPERITQVEIDLADGFG